MRPQKPLIFITLFTLLLLSTPVAAWAAEVVGLRTGRHADFHRLVVELDDMAEFGVDRTGDDVFLRIYGSGGEQKALRRPRTKLLRVEGISEASGDKGAETVIKVALAKGSTLRHRIVLNPFRIVLDIYPAKNIDSGKKAQNASGGSKAAGGPETSEPAVTKTVAKRSPAPAGPKKGTPLSTRDKTPVTEEEPAADESATGEPVAAEKAPAEEAPANDNSHGHVDPYELLKVTKETLKPMVVFNDGWRWGYRKAAIAALEKDLDVEGAEDRVLAGELGLNAMDRQSMLVEAAGLVEALREAEEAERAAVLEGILKFMAGGSKPEELSTALRINPQSGFTRLGFYLLASHFEKMGFDPEAIGYYSRVLKETGDGPARTESLLREGIIRFFDYSFDESKDWFEKASAEGHPQAGLWLADTLVIKGQVESAWALYSRYLSGGYEQEDAVTLLSFADMNTFKENFDTSRKIFTELAARYDKNELVKTFFLLKAADAYLAEGRVRDAVAVYRAVKESSTGESWAMACFSLADILVTDGKKSSLEEAERLYSAIAAKDFIGGEYAVMDLARVQARLEEYGPALSTCERFFRKFHISPLRDDMRDLDGVIAYNWIKSLYGAEDWYGLAKVGTLYGIHIPFGRKADAFLMIGRAYTELGLYPDAIGSLKAAIKLGRGDTCEEATLLLARVYLGQNDTGATERLLKTFRTKFPKSARSDELNRLLLRVAYHKGDYNRAAGSPAYDDEPRLLFMKAYSLARVGRQEEAIVLFEKAGDAFRRLDDTLRLRTALLFSADSEFELKRYEKAVVGYKTVLELASGAGSEQDRSWALYRLAMSYRLLGETGKEGLALEDIKSSGLEIKDMVLPVFRDAPKVF